MLPKNLLTFLLKAKKSTYASGANPDSSTRPASHDLTFREEPYLYIDTYLGGFAFIGEEAVWISGAPVWGMNYYGKMLSPEIPEGFSQFLKNALLQVPPDIPYRGPPDYVEGKYRYQCQCTGDPGWFKGEEVIFLDGNPIYRLDFNGGEIIP
jgi:hypothetical protein